MQPIALFLASAAALPPADTPGRDEIVVTAARSPVEKQESATSSTVLGETELRLLALPLTSDLLRLVPGVAVAASGPPGSQTQVRIRGAEANHTLLFIDGIRFNDPAAGNEARFELLTNDGVSHVEVVRGPQSALWGSEALGGVVSIDTIDPRERRQAGGLAEAGSLGSAHASASFASGSSPLAIAATAGWMRSTGIDASGGGGERDGFDNRSASLKAAYAPSSSAQFGIVGHWIEGTSQFDGFDPVTFLRADTLDSTANRIAAARAWTRLDWGGGPAWSLQLGADMLASSNRNRLGREWLNSTFGRRASVDAQLSSNFSFAGADHRVTLAAEYQDEHFRARDRLYSGATDQKRVRTMTAVTGEWRADWGGRLVSDLALRRDWFSDFADATTLRASLLYRIDGHWRAEAGYGEGIAQPTFYDLFGFFPGSFQGNPALRPERSRSWEAGVRWHDAQTSVALTAFAADLSREIVDIFDPATGLSSTGNIAGKSHRRGIELEAQRRFGSGGMVSLGYTWLDAAQAAAGGGQELREVRRPHHSASVATAIPLGRLDLGAGLAYVGKRLDTDFESYPARTVVLRDYLLASLSVAWKLSGSAEAYARIENALGADYEDVFGYATPGRTVYAGIRLRLGS
ncbi:MAG: TonB-dependent receptor plug domain-containing protein [Sphingomonadales bacterium]